MNLKSLLTAISLIASLLIASAMPVWAKSPPLKTGMDAKTPQNVEVNGVKIENFAGSVIVKSAGTNKMVRVSLKGSDELLKQIMITDDHQADKGNLYIAFKEDAPVLNDMDKLILTLEMPAKMPLDLTLVGGKGNIGPRETNDTKINLNGFGDIKLASVKNLESKIDGSGEITIREIEGDATIAVRGDGSYIIEKGTIPHLKATIDGTGVVTIKADVKDSDLKSNGAGTMSLATVTGILAQSMSGAGSISIAKVDGSLKNHNISGSAQFEMDCGKSAQKG